jgi:TP901 family phage tail tape measure protein
VTSGGIGSIRGQIRISATQALAAYASVRRANASTRTALLGASAAFAKVGVVALAAAAPIALLFKKAVSAAADFEKKIDYFGAVTNATQADMDAVAAKAMSMAKTTVFSASDMADAFVEFGKAGISTRDILNGVADATANLAQAADISMAESSNIMASQMATFNIGAKGAGHVADVLAGAANASIIDVQDLAYSLKYAGGIAASTGVGFDSLVTAISLLGQRGIKGSTAGTSLRQIMVSLATQTKQARNELFDLGIMTKDGTNLFIDQHGKIKKLSEIFQILQDKEKGLTSAEQLAANKRIFNTRALSAVQILMKDGAKGFVDMQNSINKVTASDVAHKRLDNLAGDWQRLKNNIQTLLIQVGGPLQNFFRQIVQGLTAMVQWFGNLSPQWQKTILYGIGIVGIFLTILGILSLTIALVLKTIAVYRDLKAAFLLIRLIIMRSVIPALRSMFVAMMTNPVFLIIAALALLVVGFIYCWKHFAGFRDFFKKAWDDIKGFFFGAWDVIKSVLHWISSTAQKFGQGFMDYLVHPVQAAWNATVKAFSDAYHAVAGAISSILGFIKYHWKAIIAIVLGPVGLVIDAVVTHWNWLVNFFSTIGRAIWGAISASWHAVVTVTMGAYNLIKNFLVGVFNFYKTIIMGAVRVIKTVIMAAWTAIRIATTAVWNAIAAVFRMVWNVIKSIFTAGVNAIKTLLTAVWSAIGGPLKAFWNGVVTFLTNIWNVVSEGFKKAFDAVVDIISGILGPIMGAIGNIITSIANGISAGASKVWDAAVSVAQGIFDTFDKIYDSMLTVGKNLITGIWNGLQSMADWLYGKVKHFLQDLWDGVLGFFGIKSPSKKARDEVGKQIMAGIGQGLEDGVGGASTAAVKASQKVHAAIVADTHRTAAQEARVQETYGRAIMLGIVHGLNQNTRSGVAAANALAGLIHDAIRDKLNSTVQLARTSMENIAKYMADAMKDALDKLNAIKDQYNQERQSIIDNFQSGAGFSGLGKGTDSSGNETPVTLDNMMNQFDAAAKRAKAFAAQIAILRKKGLDPKLLQELAEAGPEASGAQVAQLSRASDAQIKHINTTQKNLVSAAQSTGTTVAQQMYGAGIQAAQGLVNGIKSKEKDLINIAAHMGATIVSTVKNALKIKSPSKVMEHEVGAMMVRGLAAGITRNEDMAINAVRNLSNKMAQAHTAELSTTLGANMAHSYLGALKNYGTKVPASKSSAGFHVEHLEIKNPVPEKATDSLPRSIRKLSYMTAGPAR